MLEGWIERHERFSRPGAGQVHAHQRRENRGRRRLAKRRACQHGDGETAPFQHRQLGIVMKARLAVAFGIGQRNPQLRRMQPTGVIGHRVLGVDNAAPGRHQVHLAGPDDLLIPQAVAVHDLAVDHPGEGLQADVRMRPHAQALPRPVSHRSRLIQETPGANHAPLAAGQGAADGEVLADDGGARRNALQNRRTSGGRAIPGSRSLALWFQITHGADLAGGIKEKRERVLQSAWRNPRH